MGLKAWLRAIHSPAGAGAYGDLAMTFQLRWKEELVCTCPLGAFILDAPMGVMTVCFPTEQNWLKAAPPWALPHWQSVRAQLESWCEGQGIPMQIEESAGVYPMRERP